MTNIIIPQIRNHCWVAIVESKKITLKSLNCPMQFHLDSLCRSLLISPYTHCMNLGCSEEFCNPPVLVEAQLLLPCPCHFVGSGRGNNYGNYRVLAERKGHPHPSSYIGNPWFNWLFHMHPWHPLTLGVICRMSSLGLDQSCRITMDQRNIQEHQRIVHVT